MLATYNPAKRSLLLEAMALKACVADATLPVRAAIQAVVAVTDAAEVIKNSAAPDLPDSYAIADQLIGAFVRSHATRLDPRSVILLVALQGLNVRTGEVHGRAITLVPPPQRAPACSTDGLSFLRLCVDFCPTIP